MAARRAALLHDARFDPHERLEMLGRERVDLLCMAPTEYRVIAKRATLSRLIDLRAAVAAGEPLDPDTLGAWHEATNVWIRDGYGQTETGQLTGMPLGVPARPGSMGVPLPGVRLDVDDGELVAEPASIPTFFLRYLGGDAPPDEPWRTGDRVTCDEQGFLAFVGRTDDVIISAGYRIGPFEVESALASHAAVAEAAVVAAPDDERGSIVRAVIVLREGYEPSTALGRRAAGPRQGADGRRTSTRASSSSPTSCRGRRAARSAARRCAASSAGAAGRRQSREGERVFARLRA